MQDNRGPTEGINAPAGLVVWAAFDGLAPAEALSTANGLQMIVQLHSELWKGVRSALKLRLCRRTNGVEKDLRPGEKTLCAGTLSPPLCRVLYSQGRCPGSCPSLVRTRPYHEINHSWVKIQRSGAETESAMRAKFPARRAEGPS